jgi:hypothetical protein
MRQVLLRNKQISEPVLHVLDQQVHLLLSVRGLANPVLLAAKVKALLDSPEVVSGHGCLHQHVPTVLKVLQIQVLQATVEQNGKEDVHLLTGDVVQAPNFNMAYWLENSATLPTAHCHRLGHTGLWKIDL